MAYQVITKYRKKSSKIMDNNRIKMTETALLLNNIRVVRYTSVPEISAANRRMSVMVRNNEKSYINMDPEMLQQRTRVITR
jgi:hypothetical protein